MLGYGQKNNFNFLPFFASQLTVEYLRKLSFTSMQRFYGTNYR